MIVTVIAWLLIALILPIVLFRTRLGKPRAIRVGKAVPGRGEPRRSVRSPDKIVDRPAPDISTIYDILAKVSKITPNKKIYGQRSVVRTVEEEKEVVKTVAGVEKKEIKKWKFFELSAYSWYTYADVVEMTNNIGSGLRHIGLNPGDKVTLFASTSRDWMITALSCFTQSLTITTAYDTLGEEGLSFSLNEGEVTTLFTNGDLLPMVAKIAPLVKTLKNVIYNNEGNATALNTLKTNFPHLRVVSLDELKKIGKENPRDHVKPKPDDIACIMYTSGSTGNPKGVMLAHSNIVAAIGGARLVILDQLTAEEYYLAYLPLAHVLEFTVELICLHEGVGIGYGSVRTLTDASVRNCKGDIRELRPTLMAGVPAVWEGIRKGVMTKLRDASPIQRRIFDFAFELKWALVQAGLPTFFLDRIVFDKIKEQTGGRLKFALSGGAPIPRSTQKFLSVCVCPLVNGYGMTESVAILAIQNIDQFARLGVVGPPVPSGEVMLVDVPDTSYSSKNRPRPQGEVWIRGPTVMKGYYKQPEVTKETLSEDGWLMTGDIGEWQPDGNLAIIDRKKNLVKLSNGEYIALEKLESVYKTSSLVQNIMMYGDSEQSFCVALVVPMEKELIHQLEASGAKLPSKELADLAKDPKANQLVLASLKEVAKTVGLKPAEIVGAVHIVGEEWTPQNNMLTAAMKLNRKLIINASKDYLNEMYGVKTAKK
ncbi:long-chain fatty acid-CoA ligase [Irineochytrium annulatum]|nr:long-chain fatty acid-CoA ligase [Irineochytrium annulatum]